MGEADGGGSYIDDAVGTVVWVRRRNGSWWPGRVISHEEVTRSRLLTKRSGTPVKLLGKDDASVDWYNFGMSRRIKAFRCGEFDGCIEKASSIGVVLPKTRGKNARREDAIFQALELERKQAGHKDLASLDVIWEGQLERCDEVDSSNEIKIKSHQSDFETCRLLVEDKAVSEVVFPCASRFGSGETVVLERDIDSDWDDDDDDDAADVIPRMRDLQDFGLNFDKVRRAKAYAVMPKVHFSVDRNERLEGCVTKMISLGSLPGGSRTMLPSQRCDLKRKKHQDFPSIDEVACKKRDRRRPLAQVLKSSVQLGSAWGEDHVKTPITCLEMRQCLVREEEKSFHDSRLNPDVNGFEMQLSSQPDFNPGREMYKPQKNMYNSCSTLSSLFVPNGCDAKSTCSLISGSAHTGSATSVNVPSFDKSGSKNIASDLGMPCLAINASNVMSVKQSERLSRERFPSSMAVGGDDEAESIQGSSKSSNMDTFSCENRDATFSCANRDALDVVTPSGQGRLDVFDDSAVCSVLKHDVGTEMGTGTVSSQWQAKGQPNTRSFSTYKHRQVRSDVKFLTRPTSGYTKISSKWKLSKPTSRWIDVTVNYQGAYRGECVPLVSLVSRVGGKPVIGHPVPVQRLENKGWNYLPGGNLGCHKRQSAGPENVCQKIKQPAPWVPLNHLFLNQVENAPNLVGKQRRKSIRPFKNPRKPGSSLQKTRKLSSLVFGNVGKVEIKETSRHTEPPLVTCIPVHAIFSRIRDVVYKQPLLGECNNFGGSMMGTCN